MLYAPETRALIDDDGQVVATLEDNALDEQGFALAEAYNHDADAERKLSACLKRFFCNFGHLCPYEDREEAQKLLSNSP